MENKYLREFLLGAKWGFYYIACVFLLFFIIIYNFDWTNV